MDDPVGKYFGRGDTKGTIVGVTEDFNFESLRSGVEPLVLLPLQNEPNVIIARIRKDNIHQTIESIEQTWKEMNPASPFSFNDYAILKLDDASIARDFSIRSTESGFDFIRSLYHCSARR